MEYPTNRLLPLLPIRDTVIFPGTTLALRVGRQRSLAAVREAEQSGGWLVVTAVRSKQEEKDNDTGLFRVGTLCQIEKSKASDEQGIQLLVRGVSRFRISEFVNKETATFVYGDEWKDIVDAESGTINSLTTALRNLAIEILKAIPTETSTLEHLLQEIEDPVFLTHICAGNIDLPLPKKQEILEMISLKDRSLLLLEVFQKLKDDLLVQNEIRNKLSHKMGKLQRDSILREQLKTIQEELNEGEEDALNDNYRTRIEEASMSPEAKKIALEEVRRLEAIGDSSPESHIIRNYLDLLCSLPWTKASDFQAENIDLKAAKEVLDSDHYGLDLIKERILQHLAVMKLKKGASGSILLLVGPPGVGKTSLGQSIAKALGRKFVRGSLGGVRDDAEIRGHRRTYIGAMPGRIIQGIKRAGENNPTFLLDEVDKLVRGFQGDPAAALLEVLDPEQNATFLDHFLDVPFDLSKVFFIATANSVESIPGPLLDRMETIELSGYTSSEKHHIAKNHLIPKLFKEYGLEVDQLLIEDEALSQVITHYTREAGVRDLQRKIASICRASSQKVLETDKSNLPIRVTSKDLDGILGPERVAHEIVERLVPPGVVTGLAWTPQGGEILFIEASLMTGTGKLILTGQLGDVMKESAQIALSLLKAKFSFNSEKMDIHIHIPAGAIPKDGPSAGITILTTLASLFSGRTVNTKLAMTGEITLRGAVLPVGGIKEKILGAHRAGIEGVILPKRNEKDLKEIPSEVLSQLKIEFAETASDVLRIALGIDWGMEWGQGRFETPHKPPIMRRLAI